jgi:hypothetical protein
MAQPQKILLIEDNPGDFITKPVDFNSLKAQLSRLHTQTV